MYIFTTVEKEVRKRRKVIGIGIVRLKGKRKEGKETIVH